MQPMPATPDLIQPKPTSKTEAARRLLIPQTPWKIRRKLVALHTAFSIGLALLLLVVVRPAVQRVVLSGEREQCRTALAALDAIPETDRPEVIGGISLFWGTAEEIGLPSTVAASLRDTGGRETANIGGAGFAAVASWDERRDTFVAASFRSPATRAGVRRLYVFLGVALLLAYAAIAVMLELFVLPQQVYAPIRRLLLADKAVQVGDRERELIPTELMPSDELGEIMRSRNESVLKLREQERALAEALDKLEVVASDLKRKNHLLETVERNMADQDRLVSLGMMSAGLAHEMNTPLAVLKGVAEEIAAKPSGGVEPARVRLMLRVVKRLESLSESLLDFARVREPRQDDVDLSAVVREAWTLVRIDRDAKDVELIDRLYLAPRVKGDPDRLLQVFVNLLRNAVDAMDAEGRIVASCETFQRTDAAWVRVFISDSGPGIDPEVLPRLFEPFTSTRLDSHGTGLGLAVAEGIVREHGGVLLARNAPDGGALFEVMLPAQGLTPRIDAPIEQEPES